MTTWDSRSRVAMKPRSKAGLAALLALVALGGCYAEHSGCPHALEPAPVCDDPAQILFEQTDEGASVQWEPGEIRVTYDPRLEARRDEIAAALAAWEASCLPLCFAPLRAHTIEEDGQPPDGSIHFSPHGAPSDGTAQTSIYFRRREGTVLAAHVAVGADLEPGALGRAIGSALGLQHAPIGTDSVMAAGTARLTPTCVDHRSLCAAY